MLNLLEVPDAELPFIPEALLPAAVAMVGDVIIRRGLIPLTPEQLEDLAEEFPAAVSARLSAAAAGGRGRGRRGARR